VITIAIAVMVDENTESLQETLSLISKISIFDKVYAYSDPAEAYRCIRKQGCDVLFTETDMKRMHGFTLVKRLSKLLPNLLVVFVTSKGEYAMEAFQNGALDYILKPLNSSRLDKTVKKLRVHGCLCRDLR